MATIGETSRPGFVYDSATDTWIPVGVGPHAHTPAAIGAIASSVVTTKGDLIAATGSGTVVRQGVGVDGSVLVADSSQADGLNYALGNSFAAGKNKIINGDFGIWQRGTSFNADGFSSDRWRFSRGNTATISRQTFTLGTAPIAPYESQFFARYQRTSGSVDDYFLQRVEDVRTFAGVTSKLSFWAKASANTTISQVYAAQVTNGTGGSGSGAFGGVAITTSWVRYTVDLALPSLTGATVGAGNFVEIVFKFGSEMGNITVDLWGVQWEAGSVMTPFQTATGTVQGELAACQRYFESTDYALVTTPNLYAVGYWKVPKRTSPTITVVTYSVGSGGNVGVTAYNPTSSFWLTVYNSVSGQCAISGSAEL
jgi:hypothetical protein